MSGVGGGFPGVTLKNPAYPSIHHIRASGISEDSAAFSRLNNLLKGATFLHP